MNSLAKAFENQLNIVKDKSKENRIGKLNVDLKKFISKIDITFDIPTYMIPTFEKGKSPNLSLSCFLNGSFKKTNVWLLFRQIMSEQGRAIICFKSKVLGNEKATWWCLTDSMLELPRGITGIFISAGDSVDILRVVKLENYLQ